MSTEHYDYHNICIFSIWLPSDSNAFQAERFVVCVDQVPLISAKNPIDSLREMIELAFVLDADYAPKAPLTMEFIERYIPS